MAERVQIYEVGPRDGLQNEVELIPAADKIRLVDALSSCGFEKIEVTSFVSPRWVPQLADAPDVMAGITRNPDVTYAVLTPNLKGLEAALAAGAGEVAVFASASEGFSKANINCTVAESLQRLRPVVEGGSAAGLPVRGYVSCVTDCPFDGPTPPDRVAEVAEALFQAGCYQISLGETLGRANPSTTEAMLMAVLEIAPAERLAGHFHDTGGGAIENISVSLGAGLRVFDASIAGLGGCPYAPGAPGNVATEAVDAVLRDKGFVTGLDRAALSKAASIASNVKETAHALRNAHR